MKTMVKIDGRKLWYELERVHYLSDLSVDSLVITRHPETHELCKARVITIYVNGMTVKEATTADAPHCWYIGKRNLFACVFEITKQY